MTQPEQYDLAAADPGDLITVHTDSGTKWHLTRLTESHIEEDLVTGVMVQGPLDFTKGYSPARTSVGRYLRVGFPVVINDKTTRYVTSVERNSRTWRP